MLLLFTHTGGVRGSIVGNVPGPLTLASIDSNSGDGTNGVEVGRDALTQVDAVDSGNGRVRDGPSHSLGLASLPDSLFVSM